MKYYKIKNLNNYCGVAADKAEATKFSSFIQNKDISKAFQNFPKNWHWIGMQHGNEEIGDMMYSLSGGILMSEKAFITIKDKFNDETSLYGTFELDGMIFFLIKPPIADIRNTSLNMFVSMDIYEVILSEKFVNQWISNGFTGVSFESL